MELPTFTGSENNLVSILLGMQSMHENLLERGVCYGYDPSLIFPSCEAFCQDFGVYFREITTFVHENIENKKLCLHVIN